MSKQLPNIEYSNWIKNLKIKIREAQNKVAFSINSQLLELYWELGRELAMRQKNTSDSANKKKKKELLSLAKQGITTPIILLR